MDTRSAESIRKGRKQEKRHERARVKVEKGKYEQANKRRDDKII